MTAGRDGENMTTGCCEINETAKPLAEARKIVEGLLPSARRMTFPETREPVVEMKPARPTRGDGQHADSKVILVVKGSVTFTRESAGGIHFGTAQAPAVIGLIGSPLRIHNFKLVAEGRSEIYSLAREKAISEIESLGLIQPVLDYYAYVTDMEYKYSDRLINKSSYETVCSLLQELALYPEEKRLRISVANFILSRTNMGRSGMMRILSELRKGEYVDIVYGRLIGLRKPLPKVY